MKRLICTIVLAIASLAMLSSCDDSNKYGTHEFFVNTQYQVSSSERLDAIKAEVGKDPYFTKKITYTGKFNEVCNQAIQEFKEHCEALDEDAICGKLQGEEYYRIDFWSCDPAENWISYIFRSNGDSMEE